MGYLALGCLGVTHAVADWRSILGVQVHFSEGAYFPEGGPPAITRAMVRKIESQGGRVFVRARVEGLLWDQHGDVEGVVLEKEQLRVKAPWVVSSIGLHSTEQFLQEKPCHKAFLQRLSPLERTCRRGQRYPECPNSNGEPVGATKLLNEVPKHMNIS